MLRSRRLPLLRQAMFKSDVCNFAGGFNRLGLGLGWHVSSSSSLSLVLNSEIMLNSIYSST